MLPANKNISEMKGRQDQFKHFREEEQEMKGSAAFPVHVLCLG